jgi:uncharacterized cupin superfamily protein
MSRRHPNIVNIDEGEWHTLEHGTRFAMREKWLADQAGGQKLGCSYYEVEPGKTAFPFHAHLGNEEAIYILAGVGTLRLAEHEIAVRTGDYLAFPARADLPHQLIAGGTETLKYLCMSTMLDPEVVVYPDSNKVMARGGEEPGKVRVVLRAGTSIDYWDGED